VRPAVFASRDQKNLQDYLEAYCSELLTDGSHAYASVRKKYDELKKIFF
jgi:hypothetical protein